MLDVLRRLSISGPTRWLSGLPSVFRAADQFWNPCLVIDIPMVCHVMLFHGRFDRESWWSLGWSEPDDDTVVFYSAGGLLRAGIAPEALGMRRDRRYHEQLDQLDLGTLPAHVALRLADWLEATAAAEEEAALPRLTGVPGRRRLSR